MDTRTKSPPRTKPPLATRASRFAFALLGTRHDRPVGQTLLLFIWLSLGRVGSVFTVEFKRYRVRVHVRTHYQASRHLGALAVGNAGTRPGVGGLWTFHATCAPRCAVHRMAVAGACCWQNQRSGSARASRYARESSGASRQHAVSPQHAHCTQPADGLVDQQCTHTVRGARSYDVTAAWQMHSWHTRPGTATRPTSEVSSKKRSTGTGPSSKSRSDSPTRAQNVTEPCAVSTAHMAVG